MKKKSLCAVLCAIFLLLQTAPVALAADDSTTSSTPSTVTTTAATETAEDSGVWDGVTWTFSDGTLTFSKGSTGYMKTLENSCFIVTPYTEEAYAEYGDERFYPWSKYQSTTKNLVIEDGVKNIPHGAFGYFYALESITFPETNISIGEGAFCIDPSDIEAGKVAMTTFTIPSNVSLEGGTFMSSYGNPGDAITIRGDWYSFAYREAKLYGHKFVAIDGSTEPPAEKISGSYSDTVTWHFDEASRTLYIDGTGSVGEIEAASSFGFLLTKIVIGEGITDIQNMGNLSYVAEVTLPSTLETIGDSAFWTCEWLQSIDIPDGVTPKMIQFEDTPKPFEFAYTI